MEFGESCADWTIRKLDNPIIYTRTWQRSFGMLPIRTSRSAMGCPEFTFQFTLIELVYFV